MNIPSASDFYDFKKKYGFSNETTEDLFFVSHIAYLSTAWLTSNDPFIGGAFITVAMAVSAAVNSTIVGWLGKYEEGDFISEAGFQVAKFGIPALTSKMVCFAFGMKMTFKQICIVSTAFLISVNILYVAKKKFEEYFGLKKPAQ